MQRSSRTSNPFITTVADGADFCDRTKELAQLENLVLSGQSVVLSSPRRYGKTSLTRRAIVLLHEQDFLTVYADFFSVLSEQDFVMKLARAVIAGIGRGASPSSFKKRLTNLFGSFTVTFTVRQNEMSVSAAMTPGTSPAAGLDDIMASLLSYVQKNHRKACCVFDEFQEISTLPESKRIEGTLREHISMQKDVSFVYVGSRRQLLMDMFGKNRPFYGSSTFLTLDRIGSADFVPYIVQKFSNTGKTCSPAMASAIYDRAAGYPIYVQELAGIIWNMTETACTDEIIDAAWNKLIHSETSFLQATWMGLTPVQRRALNSLAIDPTAQPLAHEYLQQYGLSASGMAKAMKTLEVLDLIEREQKEWRLVDPVMAVWIRDAGTDTI
ncbi:AAA family ATPase [Candidatus Cryosericum terrychapinii]|uniref:ATP-binding protein n=1 Tax=Candidatus Cryosericum terrychapinii TaxID=2290919 RepID=A0A398D0Q5_9BACT|nr:ATP-binding protein [Candidatus Cryosericum terrychapinii]RIE05707.1 ATP-binding protein [Candidatus Cryosericum terrychapinii]